MADFSEKLETKLIGDFNMYNALAVYATLVLLGMDKEKVNSMNSIIERLNGMRTGADYKLGAVVVDVDSSVQSIDQSSQDSSVQLNHSSVQSNDSDRSVQLTRPSQPSQQHKQSVDEVVDEDDANG